jgi:hypothetical protein
VKQCPQCRKIYDDAAILCPYDGSPLLTATTNADSLADTLEIADSETADPKITETNDAGNEQQDSALKAIGLPQSLSRLQGAALRLVIERPRFWEYLLFSQVLADEIARHKLLKLDFKYEITVGKGEWVEGLEIYKWILRKSAEAERIIGAVDPLINVALQEALGPPGVAGDAESIVYVAQKLAELYRSAIEWTLEFRRVEVDDDFRNLVRISSRLLSNSINEIEEYSENMHREIREAINTLPPPGEKRTLNFTLTITAPDMSDLYQELSRIRHLYGF